MKILTIGDSWTYGSESSNPATMSWPAQLATKYNVQVTNLARGGSSNKRQIRICFEELARNNNYDYIIFPLGPASRTELLKNGKWHQVWPGKDATDYVDKLYTQFYHPFNDVQNTILECFGFINTIENIKIKLLVTGMSFRPSFYTEEMSWILNYKNDNNFRSLGVPLQEFNIGIKDLDRKLKCLKAMHTRNLELQPEYFFDVPENYLKNPIVKIKYGGQLFASGGHPNNQGYAALADYFANKIGLI